MSRVADEYGLDVWIWYPAMDKDYGDPQTVAAALAEWEEVYKRLPRIDVIFVPGGDPGHTQPKHLMALLEKQTEVLHRYHPQAQMWMSPQSFNREWMDEFYAIMRTRARVAGRHRLRPAGARQLARAAPGDSGPLSDSPLSRHHAQPPVPVPGARLGSGARADFVARGHQSPAHANGRHLPPAATVHHRLSHLFRRLQRRRQQSRLERAGLGSRCAGDRHPARLRPLLHRRRLCRQLRPGPAGPRAQLARQPAHQCRRRRHAGPLSRPGEIGLARGAQELAIPTRPVPRVLRCLPARPADL